MRLTVGNTIANQTNAGGRKVGQALVGTQVADIVVAPLLLLSVPVHEEHADLGVLGVAGQAVPHGDGLRKSEALAEQTFHLVKLTFM